MAKNLESAAVLFDLDGTLVDTADDLAASMNHALKEAGLGAIPPSEVRHLVGHGARRMLIRGYQIAAGRDAEEGELDTALSRFLKHYETNIAVHSRPYDGVVELIEQLRGEGARFAICTNKREAMATLLMKTLGLAPLFDAIVGGDTAAAAKPDPAPVRLCLERTGASRAVFIGDSDTDIRAAKAAATPCLIAEFGYGPITLAGEATASFKSYRDAQPLIERALKV